RMLGSPHDAEDALQETLLRAWRHLAGFEGRSSFRGWLYKIATNVCLTAASRGRRDEPAPAADELFEVLTLRPYPDALLDGLVALLKEDAVMWMPPEPGYFVGARAIGDFFATVPAGGRLDLIRLVPIRANRQPAVGAYFLDAEAGVYRPYGLMVFTLDGEA